MIEKKNSQNDIAQFMETFLMENFGETPEQMAVTFRPPFLLVLLDGFLLPTEEIFLEKGRSDNVLKTRDILLHSVKDELLKGLQNLIGRKLTDLYADWNLPKRSGLLMVTMEKEHIQDDFPWPPEVDQDTLEEIILMNSMRTQKKPDQTNFFWLSNQILLIERIGILVDVEKNLVQKGLIEELRLAKRPLEYRITKLFNLESLLKSHVFDLFVDWNFQRDVSYMVLVLEKQAN